MRCVADSACLLAQQLGQNPRFLHENATIFSSLQHEHFKRRNPNAGIPQRMNASNSSRTYFGNGRSSAARSAMKVFKWPCMIL
jgi:hypothetical protein